MNTAEYKKIEFQGAMELPENNSSHCVVSIQYQQWNPELLEVNLLWLGNENEKRRAGMALRSLNKNHISLESFDGHYPPVELLGIRSASLRNFGSSVHSSTITLSAIQIGITKKCSVNETKLHVVVRLQPSGILCLPTIHSQSFTGEVEVEHIEEGKVEFVVLGGRFEARETYEYNKKNQFGDKITHQIQRASMFGELIIKPSENLLDVHELFKKELKKVCSVLSLCYRQTVDYYEIEYMDLNNIGSPPSLFRRKWQACKVKNSFEELIHARALVNGGLQRLVSGIECSNRKDDIYRGIQFLSDSYQASAEIAYFMAFSAMETIVSCCLDKSEEQVANSSKWKKIEKALKKTILSEVEESVQELMISKLAELKRPPLISRINKACQKYSPKTNDLWPALSFEKGLDRAISIRNGLFHSADSKDNLPLVEDLMRVRYFSERLLLKLIGWKDEDIWVWNDQELKRINYNDM